MSGMPATSVAGYAVIMKSKAPSIEKRARAYIISRREQGATREEVQLGCKVRSEIMCGRLRKLELEHKIVKSSRTRMQSTNCQAVVFVAPEFATRAELARNAVVRKRTDPPNIWAGLNAADASTLCLIIDEYMRLAGLTPDDDRVGELERMREIISNVVDE